MRSGAGPMGRGTHGVAKAKPRRWGFWIPSAIGVGVVTGVVLWMAILQYGAAGEPAPHRVGPRLAVDRELIDFGAVRYNQFVEARFRLKNVGDQPLRLPASPPLEVVEGC
jgi:hypothetical protein